MLALLGVSHDVIDKGIGTGLVEGHLDESALRREEVQGLRAGRVLILDEVGAFFVGGIGEALIATATGLCVAIMALVIHTVLAQKLDEILTALDKVTSVILAECGTYHRRR